MRVQLPRSFALPPALRKLLDDAPAAAVSAQRKVPPISEIKHVVVLMQENRSFDHYFGAMPLINTSGDSVVGSVNLGGSEPQSGDGYEPTSIALVSTPTPGS